MVEIYLKFIPIILFFLTGIILKKRGIADLNAADLLLKILYNVGLPCITISAMYGHYLDSSNFKLIFLTAPVNLICGFTAFAYTKYKKMKDSVAGVVIIGAMIINNGFMIPVVKGLMGDLGLYYLFMLDVSNGLLVFTVIYLIACKYGKGGADISGQIKKFIFSPPLIALLFILSVNALQISLPGFILDYCKVCGELTIPLLLFALGIYFKINIRQIKEYLPGVVLRSGIGLLTGLAVVAIFDLNHSASIVLLLCSAAPVGYNTLTFAVLEDLDRQYAANLVSLSIFTAFLYMPLLYFFIR